MANELDLRHSQVTRTNRGIKCLTASGPSQLAKSHAAIGFVIGLPVLAGAADPYGTWIRPSTGTQVNFYDCGGKLCGKIVAVKDQSRKSEIGTVIMRGAVKSGKINGRATY